MSSAEQALSPSARTPRDVRWRRVAAIVALPLLALLLQVPTAGAAAEVHLVAAGDFGARAATNTVLTQIADQNPDAALALGDLSYQDVPTEYAWCDYVKQRVGEGFPFQLIAGNHESLDVNDGDINDFSACLPNQIPGVEGIYGREYSMDLPAGTPLVRVINASPGLTFEDGRWDYAEGDDHYDWVASAIDEGRADGATWIVVTAHIPCLTVGVHPCPGERDFYRLLLAKDVDLVLHGHEHAYMRTHQLTSGTPSCPDVTGTGFDADCVVDSDDTYFQGQGTVFATVGTGGTPLRDVNATSPQADYFAAISGANLDPAYGLLNISATDTTLTGDFITTSGPGLSDSFTIQVGEPPNQPPSADITTTVDELDVTADGAGSSDTDGTITDYDWQFGDGTTATGVEASHTYASDGTYTITLTVTDNDGATDTTTTDVTVTTTPPPTEALAEDSFTRTVSSGWGSADVGGSWTTWPSSPSGSLLVGSGFGQMVQSTPASSRVAQLRDVASTETLVDATISPDKVTTGGGLYVNVAGRRVSTGAEYRAKLRLRSDGRIGLGPVRTSSSGSETALQSRQLLPFSYSAGDEIRVKVEVTGTSPTTLRAKAWLVGDPEPPTWFFDVQDSTSGLQAPGGIGFNTYYSSSATNTPLVLRVDDLLAVTP